MSTTSKMSDLFIPTAKQKEALALLRSPSTDILLYGGSRSGKTALLVETIRARANMYPGSRHLIARLKFAHAKASIWHDTLRAALKRQPAGTYKLNKSDFFVEFKNESQIWVGGFDDDKRIEKILGNEYTSIYLNEISQISYDIRHTAKTRLAQKVAGCVNRAYYDCNPPAPIHWAYQAFILKRDPKTKVPFERPELFSSLLMNPADNQANLPDNYIKDMLETLPDHQRRRFLYGEWVMPEGCIYNEFSDQKHVITRNADGTYTLPKFEKYSIGADSNGRHTAACLIGWTGDGAAYVLDDYGMINATTQALSKEIQTKWKYAYDTGYAPCYGDPAAAQYNEAFLYYQPADNSLEDGINYVKWLLENGRLFFCDCCSGILSQIVAYVRDDKERIIDKNSFHYLDALRYGIYSEGRVAFPRIRYL